MMETDRNVFFSAPFGSEKWGMNMLWSALQHMSLHAPNSFPPLSYANFCQSPFRACVQGCHKQWASVIQPPFQVCFHCPGLQVSAGGLHSQRHHQTEGYLAWASLCQQAHSFPQPNGIKMDLKFLAVPACIFCLSTCTLIILIFPPTSGCVGLSGARLALSSSQQGISVTGRTYTEFIAVSVWFFPFQEDIFHLEPGRVESGKGKCSYDPKLNSVSALISEYHLAPGCGHGPAFPVVNTLVPVSLVFLVLLFVDVF